MSLGTDLLSDVWISSPILSADCSASISEELGVTGSAAASPSTSVVITLNLAFDPELAKVLYFAIDRSEVLNKSVVWALRMSMQEAQARWSSRLLQQIT